MKQIKKSLGLALLVTLVVIGLPFVLLAMAFSLALRFMKAVI